MINLFDFTNKKYIVTGASSGIGRSTAIQLSQQGASVVLIGRNKERLQQTIDLMDDGLHQIIAADLGQIEDMTKLFNTIVSDGKKVDGLIHCAGVATILPLNRITRSKLNECMNINFYAFLEMVRLFAKKKYHNIPGAVVAVSSTAVQYPSKCQTVYAASKGALNVAVQTLALELAEKGIRINGVMPGCVDTDMLKETMSNNISGNVIADIEKKPLLGITKPEEIASSILFLLSDASKAVTGRFLYADGGLYESCF